MPTSGRRRLTKACRQLADGLGLAADKGVARVLARQKAGEHEPCGQFGRQILGRMHREVDFAGEQRFLDFLGEKPLAAGIGQWPILDDIAGGADDLDRDRLHFQSRRGGEPALHLARLHQRQRRAARADAQGGLLAGGLCHRTFRC
jgi:hypothetical protein